MPLRAAELEAPAPLGLGLSATLRVGVLGDSIAYGQGAADPSEAVGARLMARFRAADVDAVVQTFAVPQACSGDLAEQVLRATAWRIGLALVIIGANDLTQFVPTEQAARSLGTAVRSLRGAGARVVVTPAPDLSVVPGVPPEFRLLVRTGSAVLRQAQTEVARREGAVVADLAETVAAFALDPALFSADRFHPSSAGYALIATALAPTVLAEARAVQEPSPHERT
ncbi:Lysophospholipase L1 [Nakamurella panacisegetis]|uniref:Lysophospholipase L1 n=1 Tax=Nakamurella panacisegetis TaxID=1090615 RepID=A0A1H0SUH9_9ACTN|nr:SGNH/GDSL hydrolase family protein [Nakamurella panacisegetis]SDP45249.1 Lysophospholipase L1 [Nakamurella panacisegetis]